MISHLKYLNYVLRHKYFVYVAGRRLGLGRWQLLVHDLSKFSKAEWGPYVRRFYSGRAGVEDKTLDPTEFKRAWAHHWQNNPHHWEYWWGTVMPTKYWMEMIADWLGAGRVITGSWNIASWYLNKPEKRSIHPDTLVRVENVISKLNYGLDWDE